MSTSLSFSVGVDAAARSKVVGSVTPSVSLLKTSQFGPGANDNKTTLARPWIRVGAGDMVAGQTVTLLVDGVEAVSGVTTSADAAVGYIDLRLPELSRAAHTVIGRIGSSNLSSPLALTIPKLAFDDVTGLYAAHGVMQVLSSHSGAVARLRRYSDNAERDFAVGLDGFISPAEIVGWMRTIGSMPVVRYLYDQTGNGRHQGNSDGANMPSVQMTDWSPFVKYRPVADPISQSKRLNLTGMADFAKGVSGISLFAGLRYEALGLQNSLTVAAMWVSSADGTVTRAAIGTAAAGKVRAFGRRLDANSSVATTGIDAATDVWTAQSARFDWANAKLYHDAFGQSETVDPFQTAGVSDNTSPATVRTGTQLTTGGFLDGSAIGFGWVQDMVSDAETARINAALDFSNFPQKPYIRVGVTAGVEEFRAALIEEVYKGAGLPTSAEFTTSTLTTDPLIAYSLSPSNLDTYTEATFELVDDEGSVVDTVPLGIWRPTSGTSNGKLVIQLLGHGTFANSLNPAGGGTHGLLCEQLVEAGFTVAVVQMPFDASTVNHNNLPEPTTTMNPLRYFMDTPLTAINALLPECPGGVHVVGHSGGGWGAALLSALDTRPKATWSNAGFLPLYMVNVGTGTRDFEQFLPGLTDLAATGGCDYPDLCVLGAAGGAGRKFFQTIGSADPSVFDGASYANYKPHVAFTAEAAALYGGEYQFEVVTNIYHNYSTQTRLDIIAAFSAT